jgi:hypothetical protein
VDVPGITIASFDASRQEAFKSAVATAIPVDIIGTSLTVIAVGGGVSVSILMEFDKKSVEVVEQIVQEEGRLTEALSISLLAAGGINTALTTTVTAKEVPKEHTSLFDILYDAEHAGGNRKLMGAGWRNGRYLRGARKRDRVEENRWPFGPP